MAFTPLKTNYKDDVLNTSVNQVRKYVIVNNADGSISLTDITTYLQTGTFIGAQDLNLICGNMNTIMGFIETSSGDLAAEFQTYFNEQKTLFQNKANTENADFMAEFQTLLTNFQNTSTNQFDAWFDASTASWSAEVETRMNEIVESLNDMVNGNGPFVLNKEYKRYRIVTYELNNEIRGYIAINTVPANQGILPTNTAYFAPLTLKGDSGTGLSWKGTWVNNEIYQVDEMVSHNNALWGSNAINTGSEPIEGSSNWSLIFKLTSEANSITDEVTFKKYQLVMINGIPYMKEVSSFSGTLGAIVDEVTGTVYRITMISGFPYMVEVA